MLDKLLRGMKLSTKIENEDGMKAANGGLFAFKIVDENPGNASSKDDLLGKKTISVEEFDRAVHEAINKRSISEHVTSIIADAHAAIQATELRDRLFGTEKVICIEPFAFAKELWAVCGALSEKISSSCVGDFCMADGYISSAILSAIKLQPMVTILFGNKKQGGSTNE